RPRRLGLGRTADMNSLCRADYDKQEHHCHDVSLGHSSSLSIVNNAGVNQEFQYQPIVKPTPSTSIDASISNILPLFLRINSSSPSDRKAFSPQPTTLP